MPSFPSPSSGSPPIATELGQGVRAYQAVVKDFDREVARLLDVNPTDMRCLEILLLDLPEAPPRQLANRLGLATGAVTDRRKTIVRATAEVARRTSH